MNYSVKMRAQRDSRHISGAERIVGGDDIESAVRRLLKRARRHPNGEADSITIKINKIEREIITVEPLGVTMPQSREPREARALLLTELERLGLDGQRIVNLLYSLEHMRGAALVDAKTLERLEPDRQRGVRATNMDYEGARGAVKDHFREALCLASKVASCPYILCELCISDDPGYTTGYFASKERGYVRIANIKNTGETHGGRIFLFSGSAREVEACVDYIENQPVMVTIDGLY